MTDPAARGDTLGLRLALAFLGVALAAVALLAGLVAAFSAADFSDLASRQRTDLTSAIAIAAGATYARNDSWQAAGLSGFRLRPAALPHDLTHLTERLVPELQRRGLFRARYEADTLRGLLGLARPANRYAA